MTQVTQILESPYRRWFIASYVTKNSVTTYHLSLGFAAIGLHVSLQRNLNLRLKDQRTIFPVITIDLTIKSDWPLLASSNTFPMP
jgi:hypothetical protein